MVANQHESRAILPTYNYYDEKATRFRVRAKELQKHINSYNENTMHNIYTFLLAGTKSKTPKVSVSNPDPYKVSPPITAFLHDPLCDRTRLSECIVSFLPRRDIPEDKPKLKLEPQTKDENCSIM